MSSRQLWAFAWLYGASAIASLALLSPDNPTVVALCIVLSAVHYVGGTIMEALGK